MRYYVTPKAHKAPKWISAELWEKWKNDPTLPRKTSERDSGTLVGYDPLVDMGRWNCRHRTRFISRELAQELRPDLPDAK